MNILNRIVWLGIVLCCGETIKRTIEEECPDIYENAPKHIQFMAHPYKFIKSKIEGDGK